jgi:serine phosphatase RsbU (regulator of sigma subunit)
MTVAELEHFRDLLTERQQGLLGWLNLSESDYADGALKVRSLLTEIKDALTRVNSGSFGVCIECKGEVEFERLESQPVREVCLDCITATERALLEEELTLAGKMHRALLPQQVEKIDGFEMSVRSVAARVVGGDYYDFLPSANNGPVRVVIADAMGKGIAAGLVTSNLQGALRVLAEEIESPARLIARLNRWLCRNLPVPKFISMACVAIEPGTSGESRIRQANAGHPSPILVRADGTIELLEATGTVVGVHEEFTYDEQASIMRPGDLLFLYTDGVTEAEDAAGEMFDHDRLTDYLQAARGAPVTQLIGDLVNTIQSFTGHTEFDDDLTVMALRKTG